MRPGCRDIWKWLGMPVRHPREFWQRYLGGIPGYRPFFRRFLPAVAGTAAAAAFLFHLSGSSLPASAGRAVLVFLSSWTGVWAAFWLVRAYLSGKTQEAGHRTLTLLVYSAPVYLILHHAGTALGSGFAGQAISLLSLIFILPLLSGIREIGDLDEGKKTNLLVIALLSVLCLPVMALKLLMIIFRVPAINI